MKIDLSHFEQIIDPTILKRGLQYFKQGYISEIFEESKDKIIAIVDGSSEQYTATIKIDGNIIVENDCSCPYDMGPVCKHVVALIFHIKQKELGLKVKKTSKIKPKTKSKSKSEREIEQVEQLIESTTKEQLGKFIKTLCMQDRAIRQCFLAQYQPKDSAISKSEYTSSLSAYASSLERHGFIDYQSAMSLGIALENVCVVAEQRLENGDYISAINAACAVLEQATKALQYADDSSGSIGEPIYNAIQTLNTIAVQSIDEQSRKYLLKYAIKSYENGIFSGWDWHEDMLEIALYLVLTDTEKNKLRSLIESLIDNSKEDWSKDRSKKIMATFLKVTDKEEAMLSYMQENIDVYDFRTVFIESAIKIKDYQEAIRLIEEVYNESQNRHTERFLKYLLEIHTLLDDKEKIIKFSRDILLETNKEIKDYYTTLKDYVPKDEWNDFIAALYIDVEKRWNHEKLTNLIIWEENWAMYLDVLRKSRNYNQITRAENYLPKEYYPELVQVYKGAILKNMEKSIGRSYYQDATISIRRMIKLGERQIAEELIEELRSKYKMRRALLEELDKV